MMLFSKLLFIAVIQCALIEIVRCQDEEEITACDGRDLLDECTISDDTNICLRPCDIGDLECVGTLCADDQKEGDDCSDPPGGECKEMCVEEQPDTCKLICKIGKLCADDQKAGDTCPDPPGGKCKNMCDEAHPDTCNLICKKKQSRRAKRREKRRRNKEKETRK